MVRNLNYKSPSVNILGDFFILYGEHMKRKITLRDEVCGYGGLLLLMLALWWLIDHMGEMNPQHDFSRFDEGVPQCETKKTKQHDIIVETKTCITIYGIEK